MLKELLRKHSYKECPPWLPTMFKSPCVETILYPEFSRSNRQANISDRTMDAGNHRLPLTSSPAYYTFLETTENCTLQTLRKNQFCLSRPRVFASRVPRSTSPSPTSPSPTSLESHVPASHVPESHVPSPTSRVPRPESHVPESHVPESHVPESHLPESHVPESHVTESESQSPRPRPTFSDSKKQIPQPCILHVTSFK